MQKFAFNWRAALIALPVVVLLLGLGVWQLQRLAWKENLLAEMAAQQNAPPVTMLRHDDAAMEYKRAVLSGLIDRGAAFKLWPRTHDGKAGYHWIVPMVVASAEWNDKPAGILIMVDLGWVPEDYAPPSTTVGEVESVSGILRAPEKPNQFVPPNPESGNVIHWIDLSSIAERLGAPVYPFVLEADKTGENPPIGREDGGEFGASLPNNHLQYAITWFVLAGIAVVIFVLASRQKP